MGRKWCAINSKNENGENKLIDQLNISRPKVVRLDTKKKTIEKNRLIIKGYIQQLLSAFFSYENKELRRISTSKHCNDLFSTNLCSKIKKKIMICKLKPNHISPHSAICENCDIDHVHNIQIGIGKVYRAIKNFPLSIADVTRIVKLPATNVRTYINTLNNKGIITITQDQQDMRKKQVELNPLWSYQQ